MRTRSDVRKGSGAVGFIALTLGALAIASPVAYAGPDWIEQGDAGATLSTAQRTRGLGQINTIVGSLGLESGEGADFEDLYLISITDPSIWSVVVSASSDVRLYLFNVSQANEAFGLLANDNGPSNAQLLPNATDLTQSRVTNPGIYMLGVSVAANAPRSRTGAIFSIQSPTEISGPDGVGGLNPLEDWTGGAGTATYGITLTGSGFVDVPAPGPVGLALLGGVAALVRRRRHP